MNVFSVFQHLQKDKQRKQRHSLKLGKTRRESSKRNYYIISPRVIKKAIIIMRDTMRELHQLRNEKKANFRKLSAKTNKADLEEDEPPLKPPKSIIFGVFSSGG